MTIPSFAAERRRLQQGARSATAAIDRYLLPVGRSAANLLAATAALYRWDKRAGGRTDGRTGARPLNIINVNIINAARVLRGQR